MNMSRIQIQMAWLALGAALEQSFGSLSRQNADGRFLSLGDVTTLPTTINARVGSNTELVASLHFGDAVRFEVSRSSPNENPALQAVRFRDGDNVKTFIAQMIYFTARAARMEPPVLGKMVEDVYPQLCETTAPAPSRNGGPGFSQGPR